MPIILASAVDLRLAYLVHEVDPGWTGATTRVVGAESSGELIAIVTLRGPYAHQWGPPNDEAFGGHPLAGRGLRPYRIFEILDSSWLRQLERMNSVHHSHDAARFLRFRRHFVFAFHDTMFECIANAYDHEVNRGSINSAAATLVQRLFSRNVPDESAKPASE